MDFIPQNELETALLAAATDPSAQRPRRPSDCNGGLGGASTLPAGQAGSRVIVDGCSVAPLQPQVPAEEVVTVAATCAG
jgi:hypothetical protein